MFETFNKNKKTRVDPTESRLLKDITKEYNQGERAQKAQEIRDTRRVVHELERSIEILKNELAEAGTSFENVQRLHENAQTQLNRLRSSWVHKLISFQVIKKLADEVRETHMQIERIAGQINEIKEKIQVETSELGRTIRIPRQLLKDFYNEKVLEIVHNLTIEDMRKLYNQERLKKLDFNDFAFLMAIDDTTFTHVTRYGIRDHSGMLEHSSGVGSFTDVGLRMLQSGKFSSYPTLERLFTGRKFTSETSFYGEGYREFKEEHNISDGYATDLQFITEKVKRGGVTDWAGPMDKAAVHFGIDVVLDHYYGGETGNEVFLVSPASLLTAQYNPANRVIKGQNEFDKNNDHFLLPNNLEEGIPLSQFLVFLPLDAEVDPHTGSRYELSAEFTPQVTEKAQYIIDSLKALVRQFEPFLSFEINNQDKIAIQNICIQAGLERQVIDTLFECMEQLKREGRALSKNSEGFASDLKDSLKILGKYYKSPASTVSSQEFWLDKLKDQPDLNLVFYPTHLSPTGALQRFIAHIAVQDQDALWKARQSNAELIEQFHNQNVERTLSKKSEMHTMVLDAASHILNEK